MSKIRILIVVLVVLGIVFVLSGMATQASAAPGPIVIDKYKKIKPAVTFDHAAHMPRAVGKCITCHAGEAGGKDVYDAKIKDMATAHAACKDACHVSAGGKAPVACDGCHK